MHKAERPSNLFFSNSFTHTKQRSICVQILLELHLIELGRFYFQGWTTFYNLSWSQ